MTNRTESGGTDDAHWERVASYLSDEASPAAAAETSEWLAHNPHEAESLLTLESSIERLARIDERQIDVQAALRKSAELRRLDGVIPISAAKRVMRTVESRSAVGLWLRAAAVGAIAISGVTVWRIASGGGAAETSTGFVRVAAGPMPDTVLLADGSTVILAPRSRLGVPSGFGTSHRRVTLNGLASFELVTQRAPQFVVAVGGTEIRDIGTVFTVRSDSAGEVRVAVWEGEVSVTTSGRPGASSEVVVQAGERATIAGAALVSRGVVAPDEMEWTSGRLVFRDVPAGEVAREVQRWFGVKLVISDKLAGRVVNTDLSGQPVDQVIRTLELALGARATTTGDTVRLDGMEADKR
ncbi:MAG: FecR family protein [Gemmatimonadota bacterium]